jgi:hypothetical protein
MTMKTKSSTLFRLSFLCCIMFSHLTLAQTVEKAKAPVSKKPKVYAEKRSPQQFLLDQQKNELKNIQKDKSVMDQVIADDLIVQSSECVGVDCVNNESFGFDTQRYKENNTRIGFDDTSVGSFPSNDWQLEANESASGGANSFSILDVTGGKTPFKIIAGAPTSSIYVNSSGKLGLRTNAPVLDVHASTGDTPAIRLEQNANSGFTAQTWDMAGNEANFFIRDVTGGSRLPFRIRPGAPTSSIDIGVDAVYVKNAILPASTIPSDARFKTNINDFNNALNIIKKLNPKTYNYDIIKFPDFGFESTLQYGLIAQEVEQALPTLVKNTKFPNKQEYKTVNYTSMIPILIQGMKEQQEEIEQLKTKIATYEELNARLSRMEAMLSKEEKESKTDKK